jgi:flagellar basal body-associated protein FliL
MALEHSPPAEIQPGVQDQPTQVVHPPWAVPLLPAEHEPPRQRRAGLWVAMALVVTLLLCGGGATSAYLLLRNADSGKGAPDPATAVNRFMTAVYTQQDASAAGELVCRQALQKQKLSARVDQIKNYAAEYDGPAFRWNDPSVTGQTDQRATVSVQLTMSTDDEKQAQQQLTFTVVHKTGWLVCDIAG